MELQILLISYIAIILFVIRTITIFYGALITKRNSLINLRDDYYPFVSVVVPARDEEDNIENAINNILLSDYPKDNYEIIAVNDRSSDNTLSILNQLKSNIPNLRVINVDDSNRNYNLRGKAGALDCGISQAKGELVLMTDADCEVNSKWISIIVKHFSNQNVEIISSYTNIMGDRMFDKLQAVQWIYLHKMACAGPTINFPLGCFGTNLAIRQSTYNEIGGYSSIPFSITEDYALLKEVMNRGKVASYITDANATVSTKPCNSFLDLISQLRRWARGGLDLKWVAVYFVLSSVAVWLSLITTLVYHYYLLFAIVLMVRLFGDFLLIYPSLKGIGKSSLIKWSLPAVAFFLILELLIPPLLINSKITWKGQTFRL